MKKARKPQLIAAALFFGALALPSAYAQTPAAAVPEVRPGLLMGYLPKEALPNSLALLPPPPPPGSAASALDEDVARKSMALRGTPRWAQAAVDADLSFPNAAGIFTCAVNAPITEERTPRLYLLLRRTLTDAGLSTYGAKDRYQRTRPFMANKEAICTPAEQAELEKDGSYPSGHTAVGWAWALILSEIAPEQTDAILARGAAYGESRNVCNVHWYSDVVQGRFIGAGVVARLHAEHTFRTDLEAAKSELDATRAQEVKLTRDCVGEAAALVK
jgi:acid phosphatase (class A)